MVWLQAGFHAVVDHKHLKGREGGERRDTGKGKGRRIEGDSVRCCLSGDSGANRDKEHKADPEEELQAEDPGAKL